MTTRIRLRRMGSNKRPFFRVVVADQRSPRDGRFIENIGKYHPLDDPSVIEIDQTRALHWLRVGAQPSDQVRNLMQKVGIWDEFVKERPSAALAPSRSGSRSPRKLAKAKEGRRRRAGGRRNRGGAGRGAGGRRGDGRGGRRGARRRGARRRGARRRGGGRGVKELVEFLVQELVDEPDAVSIEESFDDRGPRYRSASRPRTWAR